MAKGWLPAINHRLITIIKDLAPLDLTWGYAAEWAQLLSVRNVGMMCMVKK